MNFLKLTKQFVPVFHFFLFILIFCSIISFSNCGSEFEVLLDDKSGTVNGTPRTLYWTEIGGAIKSICTDGTEQKTVLNVSVPGALLDIALFIPGNKIYWAMYSDNDNAFQIRMAGIDGSGEELFYKEDFDDGGGSSDNYSHGPGAIAIDPENAIIYWNYRKPGGSNDLWQSQINPLSKAKWIAGIGNPFTYNICLDTINKKYFLTANSYWDVYSVFGSLRNGVACSGGADIASISTPVNEIGPTDPSTPLRGIAVDGIKGYIYYVLNNAAGLKIMRADLDFQNQTEWIKAGSFEIQKIALDLNKRKIYWASDTDNSIYRANLDTRNSGIEKFIQLSDKPTGIAITAQ